MNKTNCIFYGEVQDMSARIPVCKMVNDHDLEEATKFNCANCKYYTTPMNIKHLIKAFCNDEIIIYKKTDEYLKEEEK